MIVCVIDKEVEHIIQIEMNEYGGTMTNPLKGFVKFLVSVTKLLDSFFEDLATPFLSLAVIAPVHNSLLFVVSQSDQPLQVNQAHAQME
jgi:hypothetical protein